MMRQENHCIRTSLTWCEVKKKTVHKLNRYHYLIILYLCNSFNLLNADLSLSF